MTDAEAVYQRHVLPLGRTDRINLIKMTADSLNEAIADVSTSAKRSIMELEG